LVVLCTVIVILAQTWPICLPAGLAAAGWFFTARSKRPITSAVHAVLGPVTIGLLFVSALLLVFNLVQPPAHVVGYTERTLVFLDNRLPSWSKLSPGAFVVVVACLIAFAHWMPRLKLITKFAAFNKFSSKATAALGAATSFTFFSNVAVVQPKLPAIYVKIEAVYRNSKEGERMAVDRFLAARAVQRALMREESSEREYYRFLLDGIAAIPTMNLPSKQSLAGYVAQQLNYDTKLPVRIGGPEIDATPLPHRAALTMLDGQQASEKAASDFADEAVKAAKETLDFGNDKLKDIAWSFVDKLIGAQADAVDQFARPFIDKIIDKYFEEYAEPIVTKRAEAVRHLFEHPGSGASAAKVAANAETQSALALMNAREAELARNAANQALKAVKAAEINANNGNTVAADAELASAERASDQALKSADLARAAAESMTKVPEALMAPNEARAATIAIGAAQGVRLAAETAEAARVAESTAQALEAAKAAKGALEAVEAAKAARIAAEAAEAAKVLLRAIPK
jgi:hypothetical protein